MHKILPSISLSQIKGRKERGEERREGEKKGRKEEKKEGRKGGREGIEKGLKPSGTILVIPRKIYQKQIASNVRN